MRKTPVRIDAAMVLTTLAVLGAHALLLHWIGTPSAMPAGKPTPKWTVRLAAAAPASARSMVSARSPEQPNAHEAAATRIPSRTTTRRGPDEPMRPTSSAPSPPLARLQAPPAHRDLAPVDTFQGHWPAERLDWAPMPYSAPDTRLLDGAVMSGLPIKARLLIDDQGQVEDLVPTHPVLDQDIAWFDRLREMFRQTRFTPGRQGRQAVAAYLELELGVTDNEAFEPVTTVATSSAPGP